MELWLVAAWVAVSVLALEILLVARRGAAQYRGYLALLGGNLALFGWLLHEERTTNASGAPTVEVVGALLACVLLVAVPSLLDRGARWAALGSERMGLAARLSGIKEVLVPGLASAAEHGWYAQMARAQAGDSDGVMRELRQLLVEAEPPEDAAIQERMVTTLVYARRYAEAVSQFETHLAGQLFGTVAPGEGLVLRFPALAIQMVRSLGELGELDKAAQLVHRLHFAARLPIDAGMQAVLLQSRLYLLAYAGRVTDVQRVLQLAPMRRMPRRMRAFFVETARTHAGRVPPGGSSPAPTAATAATEAVDAHVAATAAAVSESAPSTTTPSAAPSSLDGASAQAAPAASVDAATSATSATAAAPASISTDDNLARYLDHIAERTVAEVQALAIAGTRGFSPVTFALVAANLAAFGLFWLLLGSTETGEHLLRGGATYDPAVRAGEWWRLWTAMFLHSDWKHLALNLWALLVVGRLVEPMIGSARFLVVYGVAGLAGNLASVYNLNGRAAFSLGASGALVGLVGALMVTLLLRKGAFPERWRRDVLVNLLVLMAIQLVFGWTVPFVDNFAHLGGLLGGVAVALLVVPGGILGRGRVASAVVNALATALATSAVLSVVSLVRERPSATLAGLKRERVRLGRITIAALPGSLHVKPEPPRYPDSEELVEHAVGLWVLPHLVQIAPGTTMEDVLRVPVARDVAQVADEARSRNISVTVGGAVAPANPGWAGAAQEIPDGKDPLVLLYYARAVDAQTAVVVELKHAGDIVRGSAVEEELARLLGSVEVSAGP